MERNDERMIIIALCQKIKQETPMKAIVLCGVLATLLMAGADSVYAKGCIKGAIVGGVAGHYAGHHALAGAAAGCVIGHHEAKRHERERTNSEDPSAR
jgi:uncharacterized protein YcfJ